MITLESTRVNVRRSYVFIFSGTGADVRRYSFIRRIQKQHKRALEQHKTMPTERAIRLMNALLDAKYVVV